MFDCVPTLPLLPVKKKETSYLIRFYFYFLILIIYNFINFPVFIDITQTLRYIVALE